MLDCAGLLLHCMSPQLGTNRTYIDVRSSVAIGGKPDMHRKLISVAIDPKGRHQGVLLKAGRMRLISNFQRSASPAASQLTGRPSFDANAIA
jgi:hypothetical protein